MKKKPVYLKAVLYTRVSTTEQADSGLGLEAQVKMAETYAKRNKLEITQRFSDTASGADEIDHKPGLAMALSALDGSVLLVARMDRLSRSEELSAWIRMKVMARNSSIVSASGEGTEDDSPTSQLLRRIIEAFAFFERDMIAARTKGAKAAARARGDFIGGSVPYGKMLSGDAMVDNPEEMKAVLAAQELRRSGLSWSRTGRALAEKGFTPRRSKVWHTTQVRRMCRTVPQ